MLPLILLVELLAPAGAVVFFGWLALRYVRSKERDSASGINTVLPSEVAKLQDIVTSLQSEVQGLRERQEFVERLLERPRPTSNSTM
jgi:hypothetical protein